MQRVQYMQNPRWIGALAAVSVMAGVLFGLGASIHPKGETITEVRVSGCAALFLMLSIPIAAGYVWTRRYVTVTAGAFAGMVAGIAFAIGAVTANALVVASTPGTTMYRGRFVALVFGLPIAIIVVGTVWGGVRAGLGALGGLVGIWKSDARGGLGAP